MRMNLKKCEHLAVGKETVENLPQENAEVKGAEKVKYLEVVFTKDGNDSFLWNNKITRTTKKRVYRNMVESVVTYEAEICYANSRNRKKLQATEMDYMSRSCRVTRMDRIRNGKIRRRMELNGDILEEIQKKQLIWFGHVNRMPKENKY